MRGRHDHSTRLLGASVLTASVLISALGVASPAAAADPTWSPADFAQFHAMDVAVRTGFGFTTDPAVLAQLEASPPPNSSIADTGVPLTDDELAVVHHRESLAYAAGAVKT